MSDDGPSTGDTQSGKRPHPFELVDNAGAPRFPEHRSRPFPYRPRRFLGTRRGPQIDKGTVEPKLPVGNLLGGLQQELREERSRILEPLLRRFAEIGQRMLSGSEVPPAILREGLALLEEYVQKLHDVHIRQFAVAGMSEEHAQSCFLPMALIEGEPERAERRVASVRVLLSGYEERPSMYRNLLGVDLRNEAVAELSWEGYEEDYARTCLPLHVTKESLKAWRESMEAAREEFQQLRGKVTGFLERTQSLVALSEGRLLVEAVTAKDLRHESGERR